MIMKNIFDGLLLSRNLCISPGQCCYSMSLYNPFIIVSVQGYLILINRVHLVLLILKQRLLPVYCFTIKQAGLIIIKRKALRNHTLFCTFAVHFLHFFVYLSICIHLCLKATNSLMIFPPSSSFMIPITFLFTLMGSGLLSSFEYLLVSNLSFISFAMSL